MFLLFKQFGFLFYCFSSLLHHRNVKIVVSQKLMFLRIVSLVLFSTGVNICLLEIVFWLSCLMLCILNVLVVHFSSTNFKCQHRQDVTGQTLYLYLSLFVNLYRGVHFFDIRSEIKGMRSERPLVNCDFIGRSADRTMG